MKLTILAVLLVPLSAPLDTRKPEPKDCSICQGEDSKMKREGIVSHGDFRFARTDTNTVDELLDKVNIHWIEGKHVKLGFSDISFMSWSEGGGSDDKGDKKPTGIKSLANGALAFEAYARSHAYLERAEGLYLRMQDILQVDDSSFPQVNEYGRKLPSTDPSLPYMGEGPFLGQVGKFEVLYVSGPKEHALYTKSPDGLRGNGTNVQLVRDGEAMSVALHLNDGGMWDDDGVTGNMLHHLTHAYLAGFKHNSYDTPVWIQEGLAHALEREHSPLFTSYCASEEVSSQGRGTNDWNEQAKEILRKLKKPYLEPLLNHASSHALTFEQHVTAWSMVRFLLDEHPDEFAAIINDLHGVGGGKRRIGMPTVLVAQLNAFEQHLGMDYEDFDKAWAKWAKKQVKRG